MSFQKFKASLLKTSSVNGSFSFKERGTHYDRNLSKEVMELFLS